MMTKEQIFEEFKIAKEKDIAKSTTKPPYENVFTNRLNLLKSHRDAKKSNPKSYRHLDINFDNLILAYSAPVPCLLYTSPSPRDRQKSRMPSSA